MGVEKFHLDLLEGANSVAIVHNMKHGKQEQISVGACICAGKEQKWGVGRQIWRREHDY